MLESCQEPHDASGLSGRSLKGKGHDMACATGSCSGVDGTTRSDDTSHIARAKLFAPPATQFDGCLSGFPPSSGDASFLRASSSSSVT